MAQPSNATVSIDGNKFNAMSAHVGMVFFFDIAPKCGVDNCGGRIYRVSLDGPPGS